MKASRFPFLDRLQPADEHDKNRNRIIIAAQSYGIASTLIGGNFLIGLMLYLDASDTWLAAATMSLTVGNLMQVFAPLVLERFTRTKRPLIIVRIATEIANILLIGMIPFLPLSDELKVMLIVVCIAIVSVTFGLFSPGYAVWHINLIPMDRRISYFSILQFVGVLITNPITLVASKALDIFQSIGKSLMGFSVLRVIAAGFCVMDIIMLLKLPEKEEKKHPDQIKDGFFQLFLQPFCNKKFLWCMVIAFLWSFLCALPGPYFLKYQLNDLHTEYSYLTLLSTLSIPVTLLLTPLWKKVIEKLTWQRVLFLAFLFQAVPYGLYAFLSADTPAVYPAGVFLSAACSPLSSVTISMMPFACMPQYRQSSYMGTYSTMTTLAGLLATSASAWFITRTAGNNLWILGIEMKNAQYWMLLITAGLVVGAIIMFLLRKKLTRVFSDEESNSNVSRQTRKGIAKTEQE